MKHYLTIAAILDIDNRYIDFCRTTVKSLDISERLTDVCAKKKNQMFTIAECGINFEYAASCGIRGN